MRARRIAIGALRVVALFYALASAGLYFFQEKLIFRSDPLPQNFAFRLNHPFEERFVDAAGARVHGILVHALKKTKGPQGLVLYFHGNAGNLDDWSEAAEELVERLGWDVLMIDYPGSGKSTGELRGEEQLHALADAVFALARKEAGRLPLALFGRSIGSGLAVRLAAKNPVAALVLETPYTSLRDVARKFYPWAPTFLLRYPLESTRWIGQVSAPVLILHGDADDLIPYAEGKELASLQPRARLVTIPHGRHNDLRQFPLYWHELTAFFRRLGEN